MREKPPQRVVCVLYHTVGAFYFSQIYTEEQNTQRPIKIAAPPPDPSPGGKGSDNRDTPIRRKSALCCPLLVSMIVLTLCDICMPEAFCVLETCAKMLSELCALCERKNSPACCLCVVSYSGCFLFLTEEHRRTEHTAFHRDIKSTDFTEPYSHL